jgi:PilZ domain
MRQLLTLKPSKRAPWRVDRMPRARKGVRNRKPERHRWPRLPLAIPVFVSGVERHGKKFLEFCTLLNESAGGALLAIRKSLRHGCVVSLLIPIPEGTRQLGLVHRKRKLRARVVRSAFWELCNLYGLQFVRPLA